MTTKANVINASSTKSDIIDAASELISTQEDEINRMTNVLSSIKEEKQTLTDLLVATAIFSLLFWAQARGNTRVFSLCICSSIDVVAKM